MNQRLLSSGWWEGECRGGERVRRGLFPVTYCEEIDTQEAIRRMRAHTPTPTDVATSSSQPTDTLEGEWEDECRKTESFDESETQAYDVEGDDVDAMDAEELRAELRRERALRMAMQHLLSQNGDARVTDLS